jgi:sterol 3beta-glucosyltransferase
VGASLGAGLVTLVHPFFGDQFFWARRVARLNAGLTVSDLTSQQAVTEALVTARDDRIMVEKAAAVGESIRKEKGTEEAVKFIYANLSISKRTRVPLQKRSKTLPRISALPLIGDVGKSSSDDGSKSSPVSPQVEEPGARSPDPEAAPPSPDSASKRRSFASRGLDSLRRVASPLGVSSPSGRSTPQAPEDGASHAEPRSSTDGHAAKKSDEHDSKQHAAPKRSSTLGLHLPSLPILHKRAATVSDTSDLGMGPLDTTRSLDDALAPKRSNTTEQRRTHKTAKLEDQRRRALLEEKLRGRCKPESDDDDEHGRDGTGWGHEHRVRHRKVREEECAEHAAAAH